MTNGFGSSFQVLVPPGYGLSLFRRLVYSGCKPIGHKEYLSLKLECGVPVFPDDYIQTEAGDIEASLAGLEKMRKYCARPPSKRLNYQRINSLNPFRPVINQAASHAFALITSFQRGVPHDGAGLFAPT